jgi:inositol-hexakisphosphate/diphosphoinositol-pentakisphosphate 1-kinase
LISFFSDGFPLEKAIRYVKLRKPFVVNDLSMQKVLWDRRLCLRILDKMGVPTPKRLEVNRDGGPRLESAALAKHVKKLTGITLEGAEDGTGGGIPITRKVNMIDDGDTILIDGRALKKPFVEKPVCGEDHNVMIYFPRCQDGGGGRRLFRKIGNKSSEFDPNLIVPRAITEDNSSYVYEQFLHVENAEDVKAYTVGPDYCHAETRKSPVVDGLVRRNLNGKELRYITTLTPEEAAMATKIANGFGQRICGFDLLRANGTSYVIDVNGWSFVKDNNDYYDKSAQILKGIFIKEKMKNEGAVDDTASEPRFEEKVRHESVAPAGHRSTLKALLKSPSMVKLPNRLHAHKHAQETPDYSVGSIPTASPPDVEQKLPAQPTSATDQLDMLPPPVLPTSDSKGLESPTSDAVGADAPVPLPDSKHSWKLKGVVTVIRHADRTPKQKFKFTFHSQPFVDLLKGHQEEVLLKGEAALANVEAAARLAMSQQLEDYNKLKVLRNALARKGGQPGTKVQIKPMFRKRRLEEVVQSPITPTTPAITSQTSILEHEQLRRPTETCHGDRPSPLETDRTLIRSDSISNVTFSRFSAAEEDLILDKLQLVIKWGGEPTHSARYQARDLGQNMRDDLKLMNREALNDVRVFTSSERRVSTSAAIWAAAFLDQKSLPDDYITVRKDLLDDSNAAKDVMDKVKKKLKLLLREGNSAPEQFAWPKDTPEPSIVMRQVVQLMNFHRRVMRHNFRRLDGSAAASLAAINGNGEAKEGRPSTKVINEAQTTASIQARWCTGEDAELFKERWEKLFVEFCDSEKADPSKISELYDTCKFDALHNRNFLEWIFMPSQSLLDEIAKEEQEALEADKNAHLPHRDSSVTSSTTSDRSQPQGFAQRMGFRRKSMLNGPLTPPMVTAETKSYFKLFAGSGETKLKVDQRLNRLRELYRYAKILFDYIGPQEYGISESEKLEIGLLTSLPLLREIVQDLEELQASPEAKSFIYFTKESHIYTLLNCILEGGIETKIPRATIPELDYLSQIRFELYEAKDSETAEFGYSIRISISPGCHTFDPLDVSLDSKHAIGTAPPRSLTAHQDWKTVIETLKAKFDQVKLPPSFLALNISESHAKEIEKQKKDEIENSTLSSDT